MDDKTKADSTRRENLLVMRLTAKVTLVTLFLGLLVNNDLKVMTFSCLK